MQCRVGNTALLILLTIASKSYTQIPRYIDTTAPHTIKLIQQGYNRVYLWDDSLYVIVGPCKNNYSIRPKSNNAVPALISAIQKTETPFLTIHGNVQYEYLYKSYVDTPFAQRDFSQHTVQTNLYISIKDNYPLKISFRTRNSNSPFFDNTFDANIQFNRELFLNKIKTDLKKKIPDLVNTDLLKDYEKQYQSKLESVQALQGWFKNPMRDQEIVEERERQLREKALSKLSKPQKDLTLPDYQTKADSLLNKSGIDSTKDTYAKKLADKKKELEREEAELRKCEKKIAEAKRDVQKIRDKIYKEINQINDPSALSNFIRKNNVDTKELPKGYKTLLAINKIGLGRNWIDYSELTVKNVSLTGINAEMNLVPFFLAFAAGKINYSYRDFLIKNNKLPNQNLFTIRAGIGNKETNNLIFTYYQGTKALLNSFNNPQQPNQRISGISVEAQIKVDKATFLTLEAAKSTTPLRTNTTTSTDKMLDFKMRANEAYAIKLNSLLPTNTKINAYYKRAGEQFQSFNLYPVNVLQESWMVKANQQFFKQRFSVEAGLRKNDFSNSFLSSGLYSETVFKSLVMSLKIPKYPFVSVGYYPSSQLTVLDNQTIVENQYNTLNAIVSHSYHFRKVGMSTNAVLIRFYNHSTDTGFIYNNAKSLTISQHFFVGRLMAQSSIGFTRQQDIDINSVEQSLSYQLKSFLAINGGLKRIRMNNTQTFIGESAGVSLSFKKLGMIQMMYEKNYLPGINKNLLPVDFGRITYSRVF